MSGYQSLADAGRESPQPVAAPLPAPIGDGDPLDAPWRKHLATRGLTRVPDGSTPACMICGKHFNFLLRRRHHCRRCGACVCDGCSNHRLPLRFCQGHDGPDSVQRAAASLDLARVLLKTIARAQRVVAYETTLARSSVDSSKSTPAAPKPLAMPADLVLIECASLLKHLLFCPPTAAAAHAAVVEASGGA